MSKSFSISTLETFSGVFNAKLEREDILKLTARIESLHKEMMIMGLEDLIVSLFIYLFSQSIRSLILSFVVYSMMLLVSMW
jgi:hypothetical protein